MRFPRLTFDLAENALSRALSAKRAARVPLLDLTASNPTTAGLAYPASEILMALADPASLVYEPHPAGLACAREAVARSYARCGVGVDPDQLILTASSSESYSFLLKLLCAPGDRVRVPQPSYPLFDYLATLECVSLAPYPLRWDGAWHRDAAALSQDLAPCDRAIVVVSPENPTGAFLKRDERAALESLAASHDLALVADEVFLDYPHGDDPSRASSLASGGPALAFALGGLSKMAGLPQLKVGWIAVAGPEPARRDALAALDLVADTYLSVSTPAQRALPRLLELAPVVQEAIRARLIASRRGLEAGLAGCAACNLLPAEGGWYAVVRVPAIEPDERFAERLLVESNTYVHPGSFFGFPSGTAHLVISLLSPPDAVAEGSAHIAERVSRLIDSRPGPRG